MRLSTVRRVSRVGVESMEAWQLHDYNAQLSLNQNLPRPRVSAPDDVLVEVHAASMNPIDARMREGYGREVIGLMRQMWERSWSPVSPFPLTLGRDFSGVVAEVGRNVKRFRVGDEVYGAVAAQRPGSHAQYTVTSEMSISRKPESLSFVEASSIPYVACTVWAGLRTVGMCSPENMAGSSVLVHAGAGGIGSFAIQLLKAWGAVVTTTCSPDSIDFVKSLGASNTVDHKDQDAFEQLSEFGPYDVVLSPLATDLTERSGDLLGLWRNCVFVTLMTPLLGNADRLGLPLGFLQSAAQFISTAAKPMSKGRWYGWAYFSPNGKALDEIAAMIQKSQIRPVVKKVLNWVDTPEGYDDIAKGLHTNLMSSFSNMRCPSFRWSGIRTLNYRVHVVARSAPLPPALDSLTFGFYSIENSDT